MKDEFSKYLLKINVITEITKSEFNQVNTNKNKIDMTMDLYGKIIYGFKTVSFFYFERLNKCYYIPLEEIKKNINMTDFTDNSLTDEKIKELNILRDSKRDEVWEIEDTLDKHFRQLIKQPLSMALTEEDFIKIKKSLRPYIECANKILLFRELILTEMERNK